MTSAQTIYPLKPETTAKLKAAAIKVEAARKALDAATLERAKLEYYIRKEHEDGRLGGLPTSTSFSSMTSGLGGSGTASFCDSSNKVNRYVIIVDDAYVFYNSYCDRMYYFYRAPR